MEPDSPIFNHGVFEPGDLGHVKASLNGPEVGRCWSVAPEVLLAAHPVCLYQPRLDLVVDIGWAGQPECVQHVPGRIFFDPAKSRTVQTAREHDMTIEPMPAWHERCETHPHVQGDPGSLRQDADRPERFKDGDHGVECRSNCRITALEVSVEGAQFAASMSLVSMSEGSPASRAPPHRPGHGSTLGQPGCASKDCQVVVLDGIGA